MDKLEEFGELHFLSLVESMKDKIRIVVTFIALLELTKIGTIGIKESSEFNDFILVKV
jgi:segregation and condensation protein A